MVEIYGLLRPGDEVVGKISGEMIRETRPTTVRANYVVVGALSGGVQLASGPVTWVTVKAVKDNAGDILVGASGTVYSGHGFQLMSGEALNFNIDNLNRIYAMAAVSGDLLTYFGVDY